MYENETVPDKTMEETVGRCLVLTLLDASHLSECLTEWHK